MNSPRGDLDDKDRILSSLVTLVQRRHYAETARALLWLALWPGLDAAYRRRLSHFHESPEELVSLLSECFTLLVERIDVTAVRRTAATLVRSTERDLMTAARREWSEKGLYASGVEIEGWLEDRAADGEPTAETRGIHLSGDATTLRGWLEPIVGDDAELIVAVLVGGETQRDAGIRLGLSHEAARKRFQRALGRLRQHLTASMSQAAPDGCV